MSSVQLADETFVVAAPELVAAELSSRRAWSRWWPDLKLEVREDRGPKGIRWTVSGALIGTMEVWLEPSLDGTVLHYFLHAEPRPETVITSQNHLRRKLSHPDLAEINRRRRVAGKEMAFELKAKLEAGRAAGEAARAQGLR